MPEVVVVQEELQMVTLYMEVQVEKAVVEMVHINQAVTI